MVWEVKRKDGEQLNNEESRFKWGAIYETLLSVLIRCIKKNYLSYYDSKESSPPISL